QRLLLLWAAWVLLGAPIHLVDALEGFESLWLAAGALLGLVLLIDGWRVWREDPGLRLQRHAPERWPVHAPVNLRTDVEHLGHRSLDVLVHDLLPVQIRSDGLPLKVSLQPGHQYELNWQARAVQRGPLSIKGSHLAWKSPWGLWWRRVTWAEQSDMRVYPNFNLVIQYGQLAGDRRLEEMGIHRQQRRGSGSDFHQLRDYREGDSLRQIDWHATSRVRKLIAKDYQEERDQRVVFLLDCSRRMRAMDGELSHFDQSLNALLLLAHVALKQGDEVALHTLAAADGRERLLPAGRGQRQFGSLLETVYDLKPGLGHPDFLGAAADLMRVQRRRSLVVLMTNLRDEDHNELDPALKLLRQRHLVVLADLRESLPDLDAARSEPIRRPRNLDQALLMAGHQLYKTQRRLATRNLRQMGIIHLDIVPEKLAGALVSQYRRLKSSGVF
ncbi:MAG: DUF58 domain-containing protein, partial [Pseudomonadota bacterium]